MADDGLRFTKGHGTENDFVLVPDLDGQHELTVADVRWLCDRRAGVGADGVIRVVPTASAVEEHVRAQAAQAHWFMDYRNADGGAAQMCGNGTRVFAAYLRREGLVTEEEFQIATRGGVKLVRFEEPSQIAVRIGGWRLADPQAASARGFDAMVKVHGHDPMPGLRLDLDNPHVVVALPDSADLAGLDLSEPPDLNPTPAGGANVEFVRPLGPGHVQMRVHERGVGETRSCGTGAAAAALATRYWAQGAQDDTVWRVDLPGGTLRVRILPGQQVELTGPAELVYDGTVAGLGPQAPAH